MSENLTPLITKEKVINLNELQAGDVLLSILEGREARIVERVTKSRYTHAGICFNSNEVVDVTLDGIRKSNIQDYINESVYVAAIRNPYIWSEARIRTLQRFLTETIEDQATYNLEGAKGLPKHQKKHKATLLGKINDYFLNGAEPAQHRKVEYICSELVAACFIEVGSISESASVAFQADTYSAGDLARESFFGFLLGYVLPDTPVEIPNDDELANKLMVRDVLLHKDND